MIKKVFAARFEDITGFGPYQSRFAAAGPGTTLERFFSNLLGAFTIFGGIAFLLYFVVGALNWITSAGEKEKVAKAQRYMSNALIGLVIIILAWAITGILGALLGFDILQLRDLVIQIRP